MTDNLTFRSDAPIPFKGKGRGGNPSKETLALWIQQLDLPFSGIGEAKLRIAHLKQRRIELGQQAERLRSNFRAQFPRGSSPAYLCKDTDKTLTPLRWRVSSAFSKQHARKRFEFGSVVGLEIIGTLPSTSVAAFMNAEIRRIHLNQAITTTMYELQRLRGFVEQYQAWRTLHNQFKGALNGKT